MNFHVLQREARRAINEAITDLGTDDAGRDLTTRLAKHLEEVSPAQALPHLHAALCFISHDHVRPALAEYGKIARTINPEVAEQQFMEAINLARPVLPDDNEELYRKGLIRTPQKYYIAPPALEYGSDYDHARRKIDPACKNLLLQAAGWAIGRKSFDRTLSIGPKTLHYIAVQLMPDGAEKDFKFAKLSQTTTRPRHTGYMTHSALAIHAIAAAENFELSPAMPTLQDGGYARAGVKTVRRSFASKIIEGLGTAPILVSNDEGKANLLQVLKKMVADGEITRDAARIYNIYRGGMHTFNDIASRCKTDPDNVETIVRSVEKILSGSTGYSR